MEIVKVQKTGGGLSVSIPASIARALGIEKGNGYSLTVESMGKEHKLIYAPVK